MSQPPYPPPPPGSYGFSLNAYGAPTQPSSAPPLLSTQPLAGAPPPPGSYDPYAYQALAAHYQQQQQQQQQAHQQQLPQAVPQRVASAGGGGGAAGGVQLPSGYGQPTPHSPVVRPPSARPGSALPDPRAGGQPPPGSAAGYVGSASPAIAVRPAPGSVSGGSDVGGAGGSGQAGQGGAASQLPKARSAMACVLCRRQKMKCEGPDKAPCRRCRAAQVECVFEAPPQAPPRPRNGGVSEAWVENRLNQVEQRVTSLEDVSASATAVVARQQHSGPPASQASVADHERRIAALEAQLYALQLAAARAQAPPLPAQQQQQQQQQQQPLPPMFSSPSSGPGLQSLDALGVPPPSAGATSVYGTQAFPGAAQQPVPAGQVGAYSASPALPMKHEASPSVGLDAGANGGSVGGEGGAEGHREKRWKGEPLGTDGLGGGGLATGEPDFIARGVISEEEAQMCFDSYHLTFATGPSTAGIPQTHIPFDETRRRSPLFLATVISIGARSLSRYATFHATYREAMRLAHLTFLPYADGNDDLSQLDPSSPPYSSAAANSAGSSYTPFVPYGAPGSDSADAPKPRMSTLSLKALMLLALYHSMPELLVHVYMLGFRFILPSALQDFERMSDEEKKGKAGRTLVNRGRVMLVGYLWLAFYSYSRGQQGFFDQPIDVLRHEIDTIRESAYAEHPTDRVLRVNLEECSILLDAFKKLGPGMRVHKLSRSGHSEVYSYVADAIEKLVEWDREWGEGMETLSQWGDSTELKSQIPFAHGRQALLLYVFRDIPFAELDKTNPQTREFARMGFESAMVILRWGVESRIWMPFSVTGGYVMHINIPTAIYLLSIVTRLYPEDADFALLRPILHRLIKQCDVTIAHVGATPREVARAKRTKGEVQQLDRFAFEQAGEESGAMVLAGGGGGGMGSPAGGGWGSSSSANGGGGGEDASLFGQEITASLESLRLELNLWAKPLRAFEEDL
ncbi:hypothetical protein JCM8097_005624 [Rhodosporidiobolus ruineniae]